MEKLTTTMSGLSRAIRNRVSPDHNPRPPSGTRSTRRTPSDLLFEQVHHSTPTSSPSSSSGDQDRSTSLNDAEEIGQGDDGSQNKSRPPSTDSIEDGRSIDDRLVEVRELVSFLKSMKGQPHFLKDAPPLHAKLVSKLDSLSVFIDQQGISATFCPELVDHLQSASNIRLAFSRSPESVPRRRSASLGGDYPMEIGAHHQFTSRFAQEEVRRNSLSAMSVNDVFSTGTAPMVPQPTGVSVHNAGPQSGMADVNHSINNQPQVRSISQTIPITQSSGQHERTAVLQHSSADADTSVLNHLTDRIASSEAKWEHHAFLLRSELDSIKEDISSIQGNPSLDNGNITPELNTIQENIKSLRHQLARIVRDTETAKASFETETKALRDRCSHLESSSIISEVRQLRSEVTQLKKQVSELTINQDLSLHPKLASIIAASVESFRASEVTPLTDRIAKLEAVPPYPKLAGDVSSVRAQGDQLTSHTSPSNQHATCQVQIDQLTRLNTKLRSEIKLLKVNMSSLSTPTTHDTLASKCVEVDPRKDRKGDSSFKYIKRELMSKLDKCDELTTVNLSTLDHQGVKQLYATSRPPLTKLTDQAHQLFTQISKFPEMDDSCYERFRSSIDKAEKWSQKLDSLNHDANILASGQLGANSSCNVSINVFDGGASQNIYEFLTEFETAFLHIGTSKQRANKLYKNYLTESIRLNCLTKSESYTELRAWLINKYGNVSFILNQMIGILENLSKPVGVEVSLRLKFFSEWAHFLFRVDQLGKDDNTNEIEVNRFLSEANTFDRLLRALPSEDEVSFINYLRSQEIDTNPPHGPDALRALRSFIRDRVDDLHRSASRQEPKSARSNLPNKQKSILINQAIAEATPGNDPSVTVTQSSARSSQWWKNGLSFPCPLADHDHELSTCTEFLSMTPNQRRKDAKTNSRRICWACLKPWSSCKRKCLHDSRISETIKCQGCVEDNKGKDNPPFSVLYCINSKHDSMKPDATDLFKELKKYLKMMPPSIDEHSIVFSNFGFVTSSAQLNRSPVVRSRPVNPNDKVGIFESSTGEKVGIEDPSAHPQMHDACLLLQTVKIGKTHCLVMFDRGANVNLIDGDLAERENLCVLSQNPTTIGVAGGGKISSEYGKYLLSIGSSELGWHRLTCHGMPEVTVRFPKYNLQPINDELQQTFGNVGALPSFTGGSPVSLLIGLQNVALDPVRIGILPSGLGVYQSPFTDIFGSNICYGGPHSLFTDVNRASNFSTSAIAMFLKSCQTFSNEIIRHPHLFGHSDQSVLHPSLEDALDGSTPTQSRVTSDSDCCPIVLKALIPNSKLRELHDQDDFSDSINFRCPDCSDCVNCKRSSKRAAMSMQDAREQLAIEQSIEIRLDAKEVWVDLPFITDPVSFLSKRHNGNDNYRQALKVYLGQCRKPDHIKEGIRKTHSDLVQQGFMSKLSDLPEETQGLINQAPFRHYFPFRSVCKEDSLSTPVRLVVDPTMTGLNLCLPKGENKINKIFDILIKARMYPLMWSTDIGKMYNRLKVKPSSLAYQLLLYHSSLDPKCPPEVWVLTSAWYGVVNTGNQASAAIEALVELFKDQFPAAVEPLVDKRYVDDVAAGAWSEQSRDEQISDVREVLSKGGFPLKYIVKSGAPPPDGAALGEGFTKLLGYRFTTQPDTLSIAKQYTENEIDLHAVISRRSIASKVAELYDPLGILEPIKVQLKIFQAELRGFEWGESLPDSHKQLWLERLKVLELAPSVHVPRFVGPPDTSPPHYLRLICLSDASKVAGGAVVYAGFKLPSGHFSCHLLTAKSRLLDATVPRNELSAVMLLTELVLKIQSVLKLKADEIVYATDSSIALAWCHNTSLKLRLFVYNRVEAIRRLVRWTLDHDSLPIYHIRREFNMADWVTKAKPLSLDNIGPQSPWMKGLPWMCLPSDHLPVTPFSSATDTSQVLEEIAQECFNEPYFLDSKHSPHPILTDSVINQGPSQPLAAHLNPTQKQTVREPFFIDIIALGWFRARRIIRTLVKASRQWAHKACHKEQIVSCPMCQEGTSADIQITEKHIDAILFRHESTVVKKVLTKSKLNLYVEDQGVLYYRGRFDDDNVFSQVDLDNVPFLDTQVCLGRKPVVLADSELFFAYLIAVHMVITPHKGNAATARQIANRMFIPSNALKLIKQVRNDCSKCQILLKKTVELEMKKHHFARTMIAPVFYNAMMDIAYGFPGQAYLKARKRVDVYALVIVCILSGATNILAIEGLETQNVVQALERHSARYGVPAHIFVDNGTQLKALKHANFQLRDVHAQVFEAMSMRVTVSNAKAHEERGRVERRIGVIRRTLERMVVGTQTPVQTAMQWETVFAKISNTIDDLPLAKGNSDSNSTFGFEILTANRLKLGRNNYRSLEGEGVDIDLAPNLSQLLDRNRKIYQTWYQLFIDEIQDLNLRPQKWCTSSRLPKEGDTLMFVMSESSYHKSGRQWKLGRAIKASKDSVTIEYYVSVNNSSKMSPRSVVRNPRDVAILFSTNELYVNSKDYFLAKSKQTQNSDQCSA